MRFSNVLPVLAMAVLAGCGSRAHLRVVRPAMIDASAAGNTYAVAAIGGHPSAAAQIRRDLEQRITQSLNPSIHLVRAGAGLVIDGEVVDQTFVERMERDPRTCTRRERTGTDSAGRAVYRERQYSCTYLRRIGEARAAIRLRVSQANGVAMFDRTYTRQQVATTTGMQSPYPDENRSPGPIDGNALLSRLNAEATGEFARVILPWQDEVTVAYEGCGDDRCDQGFQLVRANNLEAAERLFTEVLGPYDGAATPVPENLRDQVSEALYNRGVTRGYMGHFAPALADLSRACTMRPDHDSWRRELANIQRLSQEQEALRSQGVIQTETQDVQSAGAP